MFCCAPCEIFLVLTYYIIEFISTVAHKKFDHLIVYTCQTHSQQKHDNGYDKIFNQLTFSIIKSV